MRFTQNNNNGFELLNPYNKRVDSLNLTISSTLNKRVDILISIKDNTFLKFDKNIVTLIEAKSEDAEVLDIYCVTGSDNRVK